MHTILKSLLIIIAAVINGILAQAQGTINLHSISNDRMNAGDNGYTLNGGQMIDSRAKLEEPANFGSGGIFGKTINIIDAYDGSGSLEEIGSEPEIDLFYFGMFNKLNPSLNEFTDAELDSLYAWSVRGGKMIIGCSANSFPNDIDQSILNSRWGFALLLVYPTYIYPNATGAATTLFNGPFGNCTVANMGGYIQDYFDTLPSDVIVYADDGYEHPTVYLDCKTLDLMVSDGDAYTALGGISYGSSITSGNDIFWANTIAFMDSLEGPPVIVQTGNQLSTSLTYNNYQWFMDGTAIPGATNSTYEITQPGDYTVKVPLPCGCNNVASQNLHYVSINEITDQASIFITPNPAGDQGIGFYGITTHALVSVFSSSGKLMDKVDISGQQNHYDTKHLATGVYSLKIQDGAGRFVAVKKLVRE